MAQPLSVRHAGDTRFAALEHEYVTYVLAQFPVVATYLGGAAYDPTLAAVDGKLRDYSAAALQQEDARLGEFRARFAALAPANLSARRRIDRSSPWRSSTSCCTNTRYGATSCAASIPMSTSHSGAWTGRSRG